MKKIRKTLIVVISPYLTFFFISIFLIGGMFLAVEELWTEFTSSIGIEEINSSNDSGSFIWPLPGFNNISSYYGNRFHPIKKVNSFHDGIDIPAPQDTVVISPSDGIVSKVYNSSTVGKTVEIQSNEYKFVFHHLNSIFVNQSQNVIKGQEIGGVGTKGTLSTGNHLHFTVYKDNKKINPLEIVNFNINFKTDSD